MPTHLCLLSSPLGHILEPVDSSTFLISSVTLPTSPALGQALNHAARVSVFSSKKKLACKAQTMLPRCCGESSNLP